MISNEEILHQLRGVHSLPPTLTSELATTFTMLIERIADRAEWRDSPHLEDMKAEALCTLVRTWTNFNPSKFDGPFAYFTQCIIGTFTVVSNLERRQQEIVGMLA